MWGPAYTTETNYLRVHLANLRRKLEPDPARPRYLITEPGLGYRFDTGPPPAPDPTVRPAIVYPGDGHHRDHDASERDPGS